MADKRMTETAKRLRGKTLNRSNSALECRLCLMPGLERRCCGNYYCNLCYCKCEVCLCIDGALSRPFEVSA
jgi:hypothetical protein